MFNLKIYTLLFVLNSLLYSGENLEYFKKYINPYKKLGSPTEAVQYNILFNCDEYISDDNGRAVFTCSLIPYFVNKSLDKKKNYVTNINNKFATLEEKIQDNSFYPKAKLIFKSTNNELLSQLISGKTYILEEDLVVSKRMDLKDERFNGDPNTIKVGSIIEKVIKSAIETKKISFLKKYHGEIELRIKDLCTGQTKLEYCSENDLNIIFKDGKVKLLKVEKNYFTTSIDDKKVNIDTEIEITISNIERFQYSDNKYYLYFYETKASCMSDREYKTEKKFIESFIQDLRGRTLGSQYKWLKGRTIDQCFEATGSNHKLSFGL